MNDTGPHLGKSKQRHCLDKTRTRWNDFLFLITDDRDFRSQTCMNGLVFRECKHIKNIFEAEFKILVGTNVSHVQTV
jgi:hypothetical protein